MMSMIKKALFKLMLVIFTVTIIVTNSLVSIGAANPFNDVSQNEYYYGPVMWAVENDITAGVSNDEFGTNQICTRAQGITFLWRASGSPETKSPNITFKDVNENDYYYKAVCWGVENDIVAGYSAKEYGPDDPLTRSQFVSMLWRHQGEPEPITYHNTFSDVVMNRYYYKPVLWAVDNTITAGVTPTVFSPDTSCTRAQAISFLYRYYEENKYRVIVSDYSIPIDATQYGLSTENTAIENSKRLQALINSVSAHGSGTVYIPEGEYYFAEIGTQTYGTHCIKMRSNVTILGDGSKTVLKPIGQSNGGLDMFYYNDYVDFGDTTYLENCSYEGFVIDSSNTHTTRYTSAGKGFMFNLFKNCTWKDVTVMNTDGTGFGVDCPIGGTMENCVAINCGKAATTTNTGASGFGIGFGYSNDESFTIKNCSSYDNKKFGFFFEHQGVFNQNKYPATTAKSFVVSDCAASGNYYNFGGINAINTVYERCDSDDAVKQGYHFENSTNYKVISSTDNGEKYE